MKVWWEYECDYSHFWEILRNHDAVEQAGDLVCQHGHEAVLRRLARPANLVEASVYPAAREIDTVTKRIGLKNKFYVMLRAADGAWKSISANRYSKDEALEIVAQFAGMEIGLARRLWTSRKLGEIT